VHDLEINVAEVGSFGGWRAFVICFPPREGVNREGLDSVCRFDALRRMMGANPWLAAGEAPARRLTPPPTNRTPP
jgi:hypothetical protein